jgi:hypothetical protein
MKLEEIFGLNVENAINNRIRKMLIDCKWGAIIKKNEVLLDTSGLILIHFVHNIDKKLVSKMWCSYVSMLCMFLWMLDQQTEKGTTKGCSCSLKLVPNIFSIDKTPTSNAELKMYNISNRFHSIHFSFYWAYLSFTSFCFKIFYAFYPIVIEMIE